MTVIRCAAAGIALACAGAAAQAAIPPVERARLEAASAVVVVGKVSEVVARDERRQLLVRVESTEKLPKASALFGTVAVRGRDAPKGAKAQAGVRGLGAVRVGQRVRLYLKGSARSGYDIVEPNGLEILR